MSEISSELGRLVLTYVGPETDRVRTAVAKLAKDDLEKMRHYIQRATEDYRDVLWWAQLQEEEEEERNKSLLSGMSTNERLSHLHLIEQWDHVVIHRDRSAAATILNRCDTTASDIEGIIDAEFKRA
jgi:hypothetical protein